MYLTKKTTIWPYSNFIVILYKRFNNVLLSLFMELSRTMFQATSPAAAGFLTMRTSCGEYVTLSEMINYEVTFQRSFLAQSYYYGLKKMEYSLKSREDGVILTFMLSYFLYRIIFPQKNIPLPSVENTWRPKITKKILRWVWLALLDFRKNIQK